MEMTMLLKLIQKLEHICMFFQRQIVKDFFIKFTKKVPEALYGS